MNLLKQLKNLIIKNPDANDPIKAGPYTLRNRAGSRFPKVVRVYRKRKNPIRFNGQDPVELSHRDARLYDIARSQREAIEIRRVTRERQLEARALLPIWKSVTQQQ